MNEKYWIYFAVFLQQYAYSLYNYEHYQIGVTDLEQKRLSLRGRNVLALADFSAEEIRLILDTAKEKKNIIMWGNPGYRKPHMGIRIALKACLLGMNVLFKNAAYLSTELLKHGIITFSESWRNVSERPTS